MPGNDIVEMDNFIDTPTTIQASNQHDKQGEEKIGWMKSVKMKITVALAIMLIFLVTGALVFSLSNHNINNGLEKSTPGTNTSNGTTVIVTDLNIINDSKASNPHTNSSGEETTTIKAIDTGNIYCLHA